MTSLNGRSMQRFVVTAGLLALVSVIVGCSSSGTTEQNSSPTGAADPRTAEALAPYLTEPTSLPNWPSLARRPKPGRVVYYINTGSQAGQIISGAIKEAAGTVGWTYRSLTFSPANLATANSAYLTAVNSGADAIISTNVDSHALVQGIAAAKSKKIPIVQLQSSEEPGSTYFYHVSNNVVATPVFAKLLSLSYIADAQRSGKTAHVGIVTTSGIPTVQLVAQAEAAAIKKNCSACSAQLINVPVPDALSGKASSAVISFIQRHPDINYIDVLGPFEGGMRAALDTAGLSKIKLGGLTATPAQNQELCSGGSLFWVETPSAFSGWEAIDTVARALDGGDPSIHNTEPPVLWIVNKNNLNFDPSKLPDFPLGYKAAFAKLWLTNH